MKTRRRTSFQRFGIFAEQETLLASCYDFLFQQELEGWWSDETAWPKERNLKMFLDWFEVEFHSLIFDLCEEPIRVVEDEEDEPAEGDNSPTETSH